MTLTSVPTWTSGPAGGTGELAVPARVRDAATAVAAHARVVGLLTTETEVTTELRSEPGTATGEPTTLQVDLDRPSWRDLIRSVAPAAGPLPIGCRQPGLEIEYGPAELRIRYDLAAFDESFAERVGRYVVAALDAADDPGASPLAAQLVPAAEQADLLRHSTARALPEVRFHELFAGQAAATPDAVAVVHGEASWTYAQLDRAANRVANALLADGLVAEEVVALAAGRGREWLAPRIGIFRAGGVHLPGRPD